MTEHFNVKRIQAAQFQKDIKDPHVRVLQIDYAMAYQCELQREIMGVIWTRGKVNILTAAVYHKETTKTFAFVTDHPGKDKYSTVLFLKHLYAVEIPQDRCIEMEIIWSDGPSSEFINQYSRHALQEL